MYRVVVLSFNQVIVWNSVLEDMTLQNLYYYFQVSK